MTIAFVAMAFVAPLIAVGLFLRAMDRVRHHEPVFTDQDYHLLPDGILTAPDTRFDPYARQVVFREGNLPFDRVVGVYVRGLPSRRIGVGLMLSGDEDRLISHVSNNEMPRAVENAAQVAQVIARQGAAFHVAFRRAQSQQILMGIPFYFRFTDRP